ncbi:hypothetical protein EJ06DRAFT_528005 [Trichodelitschia bisporula]|uniref:Uncharacterized protein n=1 Tax=Trichodelitschia bisporula TaxID=703511 RepID=A0A6G1I4I8_9PEZI|nr:hypothetical protein EJ06DRAFT_528005 [Trichodelitschia bisporula]
MPMRFLSHFRSKSRMVADEKRARADPPVLPGRDFISRLPPAVLVNIFQFVCPHTVDRSYVVSEDAEIADGCMLCDLTDLANCCLVRRTWREVVQEVLYSSIRIETVHYCPREDELELQREKWARHKKAKGRPKYYDAEEDPPAARLRLLADSLRETPRLGRHVEFIKLPYMVRENSKADLARAVSACPNLKYVDLPAGFYNGDASCATLRQELFARCPAIRHMKYNPGSEHFFQYLGQRQWLMLESLELKEVKLDPTMLRSALANLHYLDELSVVDVTSFSDSIFNSVSHVPDFPPLRSLKLDRVDVTSAGLLTYVERPEVRHTLSKLSLARTGVSTEDLHRVVWTAAQLKTLAITQTVSHALPLTPIPPLTSITLTTLHFEITPTHEYAEHFGPKPSDSHYSYLATSLLANALPALRILYVRSPSFVELLTLAPPNPAFAQGSRGAPRGFDQPLEVYVKGLDETEWAFTSFAPGEEVLGGHGLPAEETGRAASLDWVRPGARESIASFVSRPGSMAFPGAGRPTSHFSLRGLGAGAEGARRSVVIGDGMGGFLAVPSEALVRSRSSDGLVSQGQTRPGSSTSMMGNGGGFSPPQRTQARASHGDMRKSGWLARHSGTGRVGDLWR